MANVKNITDLPLAESAEGLNLIVNDGGSAKQIAASAVGAQADWAETNENSPAFVKNKPEIAEKPFNIDRELVLFITKDDLDEYGGFSSSRLDCLNDGFDEFYYEYKYSINGREYIHTKNHDGDAGENPGFAIYWQGKYIRFINSSDAVRIDYQSGTTHSKEIEQHEFISISVYREKSKLISDDCVDLSNVFNAINSSELVLGDKISERSLSLENLYIKTDGRSISLSSLDVGSSLTRTYTRWSEFQIKVGPYGNYEDVYNRKVTSLGIGERNAFIKATLYDNTGWRTNFISITGGTSKYESAEDDSGNLVTTKYEYAVYGLVVSPSALYTASMICNDETSATLTITRVI